MLIARTFLHDSGTNCSLVIQKHISTEALMKRLISAPDDLIDNEEDSNHNLATRSGVCKSTLRLLNLDPQLM